MGRKYSCIVYGKPSTQGSKKWVRTKSGKIQIIANDPKLRVWRQAVAEKVAEARGDDELISGAVKLTIKFIFPRPKSHFGTGKNSAKLKPSAPKHHTKVPDLTKLVRAVEDAMKKMAWHDDSQVICQEVSKEYGPDFRTEIQWEEID